MDSGANESAGDARERAIRRLEAKQAFRTHLFIYLAVNLILTAIWAMSSPRPSFWPAYVIVGWGIGVGINFWTAYIARPITESDIETELKQSRSGEE